MGYPTIRAFLGVAGAYVPAASACYLFLRWYRAPATADVTLSAALLAVPLAMSVGYLVGSRSYFREARLILRSVTQPNLEDGKRVVAIGRVEALGSPLKSPFTGAECVAYQYDIDHEGRDTDHRPIRVRDYWGMAVWPYQIRTAAGPVRVLGYARLEVPPSVPTDDDAYRAAEAYLGSASFRHPTSAGERRGSLAEPLDTESDTFGDDICADDAHLHLRRGAVTELRSLRLQERRLEVGESVCAAGTYSAAKNALLPAGAGLKQLRISTYRPENWAAENRETGRTCIRWGVAFGLFSTACALATRWC